MGSLEMLPEIVEACGDQLTVLFDSGIRTGADVIKALSLGAKGVLVGRPAIYGLAVGGKVRSPSPKYRAFIKADLYIARCKASAPGHSG